MDEYVHSFDTCSLNFACTAIAGKWKPYIIWYLYVLKIRTTFKHSCFYGCNSFRYFDTFKAFTTIKCTKFDTNNTIR